MYSARLSRPFASVRRTELSMLKPQVPPGQKVPRELLGEELFLYQEPDQAPSEYFGHLVETRERHGDEPPILVETAFQHQAVLMGIPTETTVIPWVWTPRCSTRFIR